MTQFNIIDFTKNLEADLQRIYKYVEHSFTGIPFYAEREDNLKHLLRSMHLKMIFALEALGQAKLMQLYLEEVKNCLDNPLEEVWDEEYDYPFNVLATIIAKYKNVINCQTRPVSDNDHKIDILELILENTGKIITDSRITASNEKDVENVLYDYLSTVYPDTVRQPVINQILKNYKPDCGIRSLKCAIEYKFIDSSEKMTKWLGELLDDIMGYRGSEQWNHFYAVVYITGHFRSKQQIEAELSEFGVSDNWKVFLIFGTTIVKEVRKRPGPKPKQ